MRTRAIRNCGECRYYKMAYCTIFAMRRSDKALPCKYMKGKGIVYQKTMLTEKK